MLTVGNTYTWKGVSGVKKFKVRCTSSMCGHFIGNFKKVQSGLHFSPLVEPGVDIQLEKV